MVPIVRFFASEQAARDAVAKLVHEDIPRANTAIIIPNEAGSGAAVDAAVGDGVLPAAFRAATTKALARGRSVVCVTPPYAMSGIAERVMDLGGAVDTADVPEFYPDDPSPFSDLMGMPTLTKSGRSSARLSKSHIFPSWLGLGLSSKKATPLSSMFGMKTLSIKRGSQAAGTPVAKMSGDPAPFSSKIGLPLLTKSRTRASR